MASIVTVSANEQVDTLLEEVCVALQLTETQYTNAEEKYRAIGAWLSAADSPLAPFAPVIYPQGSIALQTTVRPRRDTEQAEYDVDLVHELKADVEPMALYKAVERRLASHTYYRQILEPKKRCLRLNYAGEFHMDILPAVPDPLRGGTCILVPDRELQSWTESNPRGFVHWFNDRAGVVVAGERKAQPLPANDPAYARPPLKRAVQLLKRHRDIIFGANDAAPRSVVLTTLAGHHYRGEQFVVDALLRILDGVMGEIEATPGIMLVANPTNPEEHFSEAWDEESYARFVDFISRFRTAFRSLLTETGMSAIRDRLSALFGEEPTLRALDAFAKRVEVARSSGALRVGAGLGLTTRTTATRSIPRNTFFGE
ncbi:MAG: nucleotidyltransferase [Candidatus Rokubacteria bacterium]|nr:nucleotidyltransferase [Candidatus Rokubacteria bacterium]